MLQQSLQNLLHLYSKKENEASQKLESRDFQEMSLSFIFLLAFAFIISGIFFFFAYNWQAIPSFVKFATIQVFFIMSCLASYKLKIDSAIGKFSLTTSSLLVGVFFAVFGQVYQTGADSYQFFTLWAVCILPFVLISKFSLLWIFELILIITSAYLAWNTFYRSSEIYMLYLFLTILNALVLFLRELFVDKFTWLDNKYTRLFPYAFLQVSLAGLIIGQASNNPHILYDGLGFLLLVGLFYYSRYKMKDIVIVGLTVISSIIILFSYTIIKAEIDLDGFIPLCFFAIFCLWGTAAYLGNLQKKFKEKTKIPYDNLASIEDINQQISEEETSTSKKLSIFNTGLCLFTAIITSLIIVWLFVVFIELTDAENSYLFIIFAGLSLVASIACFRAYKKDYKDKQEHLFLNLYSALTLLITAYILLAIELLVVHDFSWGSLSLVFLVINITLYPFVSENISRMLLLLSTAILIYFEIYDDSLLLLIFSIISILLMTVAYILRDKHNILQFIAKSAFLLSSANLIIMLADSYFLLLHELNTYYFSIFLAIWICVIYLLYTIKLIGFWRNLNFLEIIMHLFALIALAGFAHYGAYPILYLIGILLLSVYIEKLSLLKNTILLSLPILFYFYYSLNILLLYKSYILITSGAILFVFCAYMRRSLQNEK